jgi:hypothetical protein
MAKTVRGRRASRSPIPIGAVEFSVDPLLVGADREFVESFPPGLPAECGVVPLRRYHEVGLVVPRSGPAGQKGLQKLQKASRVRLVAVPPIHDYGVDLFLRYLDKGTEEGPPLWLPESRRAYLSRQGEFTSPKTGPLIASIILTSPLVSSCPVLVCCTGGQGYVLYLHGTGLKVGARFPAKWFDSVLGRLRIEFGLEGKKEPVEPWMEGRGLGPRGLDDLNGLLLPPLDLPSFVIEPKSARR